MDAVRMRTRKVGGARCWLACPLAWGMGLGCEPARWVEQDIGLRVSTCLGRDLSTCVAVRKAGMNTGRGIGARFTLYFPFPSHSAFTKIFFQGNAATLCRSALTGRCGRGRARRSRSAKMVVT